MRASRRGFLGAGAALGAALWSGCAAAPAARPRRRRLLVLGGTRFVGPAIVEAALARGHEVTLFNRGRTNPGLFPQCETLHGDRDGDLSALTGRRWDAVLDTWTDLPRHVRSAAALLAPAVEQYLFVSSLNAVADLSRPGLDESAERTPLEPGREDDPAPEHFGGRKARCEELLAELCPASWTVVRPGLIVGPGDASDRFTYWPVRAARGGEVLAPGDGRDPAQLVDVRDLGAFVVRLVEERTLGLFHAVGPERRLEMRELLETCVRAAASDARLTWVATDFLLEQGVAPWTDLPVWLPSLAPGEAYWTLDVSRAIAAGLRFRPLADTARDTLAWWRTLPEERRAAPKRGLDPERERTLLALWHAREPG